MLLCERLENVSEALSMREIRDICLFIGTVSGLLLLQIWLNKSDCKTKDNAKVKLNKNKKAKNVLATIDKIKKSNPEMKFDADCNIGTYVEMGIHTTSDLKKYIAKFKDKVMKNTNDGLKGILEYGEDKVSYDKLIAMKGIIVISDGGGNDTYLCSDNKLYEWDHETHELTNRGTYEEYIINNIDYLEYTFKKDNILVVVGDDGVTESYNVLNENAAVDVLVKNHLKNIPKDMVKWTHDMVSLSLWIKKIPENTKPEDIESLIHNGVDQDLVALQKIIDTVRSKPASRFVYGEIQDLLNIGIYNTATLKKYMAKFKTTADVATRNSLSIILDDSDDEGSYDKLVRLKAKWFMTDAGGNEYFIVGDDVYVWSHDDYAIKKTIYEEFVFRHLMM